MAQYVARPCSSTLGFEAFESQSRRTAAAACLLNGHSCNLRLGCHVVADTTRGACRNCFRAGTSRDRDRRSRCPRPIRASLRSALSPSWRPVPTKRKNTSWSSPSPFPRSQSITANTSKPWTDHKTTDQNWGLAIWPGPFCCLQGTGGHTTC